MSLKARLLVGMGLVAVILVAVALIVTQATEANLVHQIDSQLARATPQLRAPSTCDPTADFDVDRDRDGRLGPGERPSDLYVGVVVDGEICTVARSNLAEDGDALPDLDVATLEAQAGAGPFTVGSVASDLQYRVVAVEDPFDGDLAAYALPLADVDEAVRRLIAVEAFATVLILGALGLVTFWVLRLGVRPVKQMTTTAAAIGEGDLSQRIPEAVPGTEAGDLGIALNKMLGRIEDAFDERTRSEDRLRRFVADASHELRTPVTTIRGYAELFRMGGLGDPTDLSEAMRRTEQESIRMGDLVEDLLHLARLDEGRPLAADPVDLAAVVADAALDARAVEPDRPITVDAPVPVVVLGDDSRLRQVVANLVANARVHTPADTPVHLRAWTDGTDAVVEVADEGPGMDPEIADRVFERFFRADPARTRHTGGSGLGLSIVEAVVRAHGGTMSLVSEPGAGTAVRARLPLRPTGPSPEDQDPLASPSTNQEKERGGNVTDPRRTSR